MLAVLSACLLAGACLGIVLAEQAQEGRTRALQTWQREAAENAASIAALRNAEAQQEHARQARLRWIESFGKD